jgi:hypothetical protein
MDNKIFFSIISAIVLMICSLIFVFIANSTPSVIAQTNLSSDNATTPTSNALDCSMIPSKIEAEAVSIPNPNREVCDIIIMRDSPQIKGHNGTILNKFLAINSLIEITPVSPNMMGEIKTTPQSSSNPKVIAMGEFALLETELKPVLKAIARSDWNITAVHNHPILEKPSMIFVHWDALGDLNTIINQTKGALVQTSIAQGSTSGGGGTTSSAATTLGEDDGTDQATQQQRQQNQSEGGADQQKVNNQTQKDPLEQLGETIFGGGQK